MIGRGRKRRVTRSHAGARASRLAWQAGSVERDRSRHRTEAALEASERKFRELYENLRDGAAAVDTNGRIVEGNRAFASMLGYTPEELGSLDFRSITPTRWHDMEERIIREHVLTRGYSGIYEKEYIRKDGTVFPVELSTYVLRDGAGAFVGLWAFVRDITSRRGAERALLSSQRRLADIIDFLPDATLVIDINGRVVAWNRAIELMTGVPASQMLGEGNYEYALPFYGERRPILIDLVLRPEEEVEKRYSRVRREGPVLFGETYLPLRGRPAFLVGRAAQLRDEAGNVVGAIEIIRDHTDRKHGEEELVRAKEAADAANRAKSAFLANMSHEIRTPLHAILGFSQIMQRDPALSPEQRMRLETINRSGEHLLTLINDILEVSRIEAGRARLNDAPFNLHLLLSEIESLFRVRAQSKGLLLTVERGPEVPRDAVGDAGKLRQILMNLLGNAVKFTEEGGISLFVSATRPEPGRLRLVVDVEDTGVGIASEDHARLFAYFEQASRGIQSGEGTGLGLAISREFARLMGGEITVRSTPGMGSCFTLTADLGQALDPAEEAVPLPAGILRLAPGQGPLRILVADDREANRIVMLETLDSAGYDVHLTINGEDAVAEFEAWQPHLILMDLRMPVLSGWDAIRLVRATSQGEKVPIIAVSASAFDDDRTRALAAGANDFLAKPYREADLLGKVGRLLGVTYERVAHEMPPAINGISAAGLPSQVVENVRDATLAGDLDRVLTILDAAAPAHPESAARLRELATSFQYDVLLGILAQKR
ncbi:MAG: PAS domain S-box protein [Thermoanaerobaculia bacterium]|nr:PAS domain S-box protein [Thermoanaerobaculia bacterium]